MRPLHELLLDEIQTERRRLSRRGLLSNTAKLAGGAALAMSMGVVPSPISIRHLAAAQEMTGMEVLNYALTLEHLEYAFYRDGLALFSAREFKQAGFGKPAYGRLKTIREHERIHVETLTDVITDLGGDPVEEAPCYNFAEAFRSVKAFLATAQLLENTGVSAYDGAIALIESAELQTAGATIATVEARHAAYLNDLNGDSPFPAAFDEPKTPEQILAAAAPFFECDAGA